jgi:hypothetical protein
MLQQMVHIFTATLGDKMVLHSTFSFREVGPHIIRRWEDNIKMDPQEVRGGRGDWMEVIQDRDRWRALVGTVRNFRVP